MCKKDFIPFVILMWNLFDGPTTRERPRLRDDRMDSHQTLRASNSQGLGAPNERVSEVVTVLAQCIDQLSSANKRDGCRRVPAL